MYLLEKFISQKDKIKLAVAVVLVLQETPGLRIAVAVRITNYISTFPRTFQI